MLPTATELGYFYEVAKAANFSHAAKNINISQPTLSMAIKRLEESLNTTLFYRQKHGLILTRAGSELFSHVRDLLDRWEKIRAHMIAANQEIKGRVVIGCNSAYVPFMAETISKLLQQYPALDIEIINDTTHNITERLLNATMDIGIAWNPVQHANLVISTISNPTMTFWIRKDSPALKKSLITGDVVIICDQTLPQTKLLLEQLPPTVNVRATYANSQESIAHLIVNGDAIGILPECFVRAFYEDKLERVVDAPCCVNTSCLLYRAEDKEVAAVQLVISAIKCVIKDYQQKITLYQ